MEERFYESKKKTIALSVFLFIISCAAIILVVPLGYPLALLATLALLPGVLSGFVIGKMRKNIELESKKNINSETLKVSEEDVIDWEKEDAEQEKMEINLGEDPPAKIEPYFD